MSGQELLRDITSKRDYSGSDEDRYAQLLMTIWSNIKEGIYPILEKADKEGKKLNLKAKSTDSIIVDEIVVDDIILVS
ncbi:MAG: hypothetical protein Q8R83_06045 [Legionellaceae bacterium]|nr:hypothetical protein [Legionellaceae bacterium]